MAVNLEEFCIGLHRLGRTQTSNALAILWFSSEKTGKGACSAGEIARCMRDNGLGNPNSTRLGLALRESGHVLRKGNLLSLKPTSRERIVSEVVGLLEPQPPTVPLDEEFIPNDVWKGTRGYIERVAEQINGTYHCTYYDATSVMCRRLIEILLIEAFEYAKKDSAAKDANGEYLMLSRLIDVTLGPDGFSLGRETKKVLRQIKEIGDRSAHNRRYVAVRADLDQVRSGFRLLVDELLHLCGVR